MNTSVKMARVVPVVRMALLAIIFLSQIPSAQASMMTVLFSVKVTEVSMDHDDMTTAASPASRSATNSREAWSSCPTACGLKRRHGVKPIRLEVSCGLAA